MTDTDQDYLRDVSSERGVLAGVFAFGGDAYTDVADLITTKTLTDPSNKALWACVEHVYRDDPRAKIDYPTILSASRALGFGGLFDTNSDEIAHVRSLMNFPVQLENVRKYAGVLKKLEFARDALGVVDGVRANILGVTGHEPIEKIIADIEGPILDIASLLTKSGTGPEAIGLGLEEYIDYLANNVRDVVGIPSGFRQYDRAIGGGFRPGTVNCIGARPKVGKTLLGMNIGYRVASGVGYEKISIWDDHGRTDSPPAGVPVLYLDTEMTREDQWIRMLALVSGVTIEDIETGKFAANAHKKAKVDAAAKEMARIPFEFLSIAGQPFEETLAVMRRWVTKSVGTSEDGTAKPCLIIFDYLKLMSSESMESKQLAEFQVLGFMMTQLHNFAVKFKVPILTFVQLNRDGINVEDTSAVSQSDRIIWLCSNFSIYKKKSDEELAEQAGSSRVYNRKLVPIVARHGAGLDDGDYINVMSHGEVARIVEGPTRDQFGRGETVPGGKPQGIIVHDSSTQPEIQFAA